MICHTFIMMHISYVGSQWLANGSTLKMLSTCRTLLQLHRETQQWFAGLQPVWQMGVFHNGPSDWCNDSRYVFLTLTGRFIRKVFPHPTPSSSFSACYPIHPQNLSISGRFLTKTTTPRSGSPSTVSIRMWPSVGGVSWRNVHSCTLFLGTQAALSLSFTDNWS